MPLWRPWRRREPETRAAFTEIFVAGMEALATERTTGAYRTTALEAASGLWAKTLAAARVEGPSIISPRILHHIGREMIREGEVVVLIDTDRGRGLRLLPVYEHDVEAGWRYRVTRSAPPGRLLQRTVPRGQVIHAMWAVDPGMPWRGIGPLAAADLGAQAAANAERTVANELGRGFRSDRADPHRRRRQRHRAAALRHSRGEGRRGAGGVHGRRVGRRALPRDVERLAATPTRTRSPRNGPGARQRHPEPGAFGLSDSGLPGWTSGPIGWDPACGRTTGAGC